MTESILKIHANLVKHPRRNSQCPARQRPSGLVRSQPPAGAAGSSGLQSHKPGPETAPWLLYGLGRNQPTCRVPPPAHLFMKRPKTTHTVSVQTEASRAATLATKPSVTANSDNDSLFCAGLRMDCFFFFFFLRSCFWMRSLTFCKTWHWEWNTDDSYQVFYWYQRPKNGSDAYCFTFAGVD